MYFIVSILSWTNQKFHGVLGRNAELWMLPRLHMTHDATKKINIHGAATQEIKAVTHGDISQYTSDNHQDQEPVHLVYAADDDDDSMRGVEQSISPSSILHRNQSSFITLATSPFLLSKKKYTFIICIISLNNIISKILSIRKRDLERNERHSMVVLRIMYGSS